MRFVWRSGKGCSGMQQALLFVETVASLLCAHWQYMEREMGPGCVLRITGDEFDVERMLAIVKVHPCKTFKKGRPVFGLSPAICKFTGANFVTGDGEELSTQVEESIAFILSHHDDVLRMMAFDGVQD